MLLSVIIVATLTAIVSANNQKCAIPKIYEELGCVGKDLDITKCPTRYNCPDVDNFDVNMCHYKGKSYKRGAKLTGAAPNCLTNCRCSGSVGEPLSFKCAKIECPEELNEINSCISQYIFGKCCATNLICDENEKLKLLKCQYKGHSYIDGEMFYPSTSPCYRCICDKNFDSSVEVINNQNCQRIDCGIEIRNWSDIRKGCAPIYFQSSACCPTGFRCPSKQDQVLPIENLSEKSSKYKCKFGNLSLDKGQVLKSVDKCVKCACTLPPMIECIRTC